MTHCESCNGLLRNNEVKCYRCDAPVIQRFSTKVSANDRFRTVLTIAFILSGLMTAAHIFVSFDPSFVICLVVTIVLMLVKSSADQMSKNK
jgi:hypothetical protein